MDSKKILALVIVALVAVASVGIYVILTNNNEKDSLRVVYLNKGGYESMMVAEEKGFYNDLGFNVERLLVTGSGQNAVDALLAGDADIAATGEGPVINTLNTYMNDIVLLGSYTISIGGQEWVAQGDSSIGGSTPQAVADSMKGKVAGVIGGSSTESIFKRWCAAYNLEIGEGAEKLNLKTITDGPALLEAFATKDIELLAASQPYPSTAVTELGGKKVGSSADINANSLTMFVTTKEKYDANKENMKAFVTAIYETTKYINANKTECIQICADRIGISVAEETTAFAGTTFKVSYNDVVINTLFAAAQAKSFTNLTVAYLTAACPLKAYLDSLA